MHRKNAVRWRSGSGKFTYSMEGRTTKLEAPGTFPAIVKSQWNISTEVESIAMSGRYTLGRL
ncbi:hypothetical protein SERLA73DRAFT_136995 [Serpula lacrymans var. lacrymans S7.3]|uniref:Uncharacterized protein n=2 Tax=Serpula lacrymans var. lacrymans TaxID=341189 RepID=F8PYH8_SERL3|nr:uncharacterized protein SERLADRAFT_389937 [Serpula lacrymans var. lacrymans S7.9]EGN98941.1 hypothetical protein SERLA73DRAFT_136995 [Serpula lacrymans var. lacrymans S7.3]EGO24531.1 hypothetical protein SERLADRAFT_389937 [Serpula lacrymans var. lacrymans S7.9]